MSGLRTPEQGRNQAVKSRQSPPPGESVGHRGAPGEQRSTHPRDDKRHWRVFAATAGLRAARAGRRAARAGRSAATAGLRAARAGRRDWKRLLPVTVAAALSAAYVIFSPPSLDLAAHLFRAQLFGREPFGIWNNYWYSGHHIVGYSLLFPAASWALTPQLAAALAATATAALFEPLARRHFGEDAWLGATVFAAATAANLFTGRLAFAFGALPGMAAVLAIDRRRPWLACALAFITALSSPVAALFVALAGAAYALGQAWQQRRAKPCIPGLAVAIAALAPVGALAAAFPEGGTEPFVFNAFIPIPLIGVAALLAIGRRRPVLAAGVALYTLGTIASYLIPSAIGSNADRLGTWLAAPLAALLWWRPAHRGEPRWRRHMALLAVVAAPALYLQWHDPVRDLTTASSDPSNEVGYYRPLLNFLKRQPGPPFRVEIPFTSFHWEAYAVASHFPIARGWERQLDIKDNPLFYDGRLTPARYESWLHADAVRFVAVAKAPLDYAGRAEGRLISRGLPYLKPVMRDAHWRVYAVKDPTPIAQGAGALTALGPDWVRLDFKRPGEVLLRVHFTPYWALTRGSGCVGPAGRFTRVLSRRPGPVTLGIDFSLGRIGATSPRCTADRF
jgi:hypothetical protein